MFPWVYEFKWELGHIIFTGGFFTVAVIVATTLTLAIMKLYRNYRENRVDQVMWEAAFEDFPTATRRCRHEMTGLIKNRVCPNHFDCRECKVHQGLLRHAGAKLESIGTDDEIDIVGLQIPLDRMYHRGHTWVKRNEDGTYIVGLDDLGKKLIGEVDQVTMPEIGSRLHANGTAWKIRTKNADTRILSPIDGEVIEIGGNGTEWFLRVKPTADEVDTSHLLKGREVKSWFMREIERLQFSLASDGVGASLADGGALIDNLPTAHPEADWDGVYGEMFLEP
jgi:glycine cleavage system H protein